MEKIEFPRFIERYLDGSMQDTEKQWFEAEVDGNPWLKNELELRRKTNLIIENTEAIDFREVLMEVEKEHRASGKIIAPVRRHISQYAAIFIGLVLIGSIFIFNNTPDYSRLADEQSVDFVPIGITRSENPDLDRLYNKAVALFNTGDYQSVINLLSDIEEKKPEIHMVLGSSNMKVEKYDDAITSFTSVLDNNDNLFMEEARWLLGLCYLNTNDTENARPVLEGIIRSESRYKKEAKKILRKL